MVIYHDDSKYILNENDSKAMIKYCVEDINRINKLAKEKESPTISIMYLLVMKALCEQQLNEIGNDVIVNLFYKRMRVEKIEDELDNVTEDESNI